MKFISKILDYLIPITFFLFILLISSFILADVNDIDPPKFHIWILFVMILNWPITIGILGFISGMGVINLFYKTSIKKELKDD